MVNINTDYADYKCVNRHNGYTVGMNNDNIKFNELEKKIVDRFQIQLTNAKGLLIVFIIKDDTNIDFINHCMEKIGDIMPESSDIILGIEYENNRIIDEVQVNFLITGLENI